MNKFLISDTWAYYINPDKFSHRREAIENLMKSLNLAGYTRIAYNLQLPDRANTMSSAHIAALQQAVIDNNFPCIIFEDDADLMQPLPEYFEIPKETRLLYLGGSYYDCGQGKPNMYIADYNTDYYRIYYMLSFHSVMIPNKESAKWLIDILTNAVKITKFNDICIAMESKNNLYLAPKEGNYFYQNDYTSTITKFYWKDILKKVLR
jgi:hypothetical protein